MRRHRLLLLLVILAVSALAGGCGGGGVEYEQVKAAPPVLEIPDGSNTGSLASGEDAGNEDDDPDADETPTPTPTAAGDTGATAAPVAPPTGTGTTAPPTDTGGAAPETEQPAQPEQPQDTGGAGADAELDQFCADNPGACDG